MAQEGEPLRLSFRGSAIMFPIEGWGIDDYSFRAPVGSIAAVDWPGGSLTRLDVALARPGERDFDAPIYAAQHVIKNGSRIAVGADVSGAVWLQGSPVERLP